MAKPFDPLLEKQVKLVAVHLVVEDVLPVVTPQDHMIESTREMYPLSARH
ncbi:hypothetical protein [Geomonas anaerohicana]|nr:hypothetical protein [Geomonas anaerohicana]